MDVQLDRRLHLGIAGVGRAGQLLPAAHQVRGGGDQRVGEDRVRLESDVLTGLQQPVHDRAAFLRGHTELEQRREGRRTRCGQFAAVGDGAVQHHAGVVGETGHQCARERPGGGAHVEQVAQRAGDVVDERETLPRPLDLLKSVPPFGDVHDCAGQAQHAAAVAGQSAVGDRAGSGAVGRRGEDVDGGSAGAQDSGLDLGDLLSDVGRQHVVDGTPQVIGHRDPVQAGEGLVHTDVTQVGVDEGDPERRGGEEGVEGDEVVLDGAQPACLHRGGDDDGSAFSGVQHHGPAFEWHVASVAVPDVQQTAPVLLAAQRLGDPPELGGAGTCPRRQDRVDGPAEDVIRRPAEQFLSGVRPQQNPAARTQERDGDAEGVQRGGGVLPGGPAPGSLARRCAVRFSGLCHAAHVLIG